MEFINSSQKFVRFHVFTPQNEVGNIYDRSFEVIAELKNSKIQTAEQNFAAADFAGS